MALTNYLEDDWGDNSLSGRSSASKDVFYMYGTGGAGDLLKGVYRPVWTVDSGTGSVSGGALIVDDGDNYKTPSVLTVGSWKYDWTGQSSLNNGSGWLQFFPIVVSLTKPVNDAGYENNITGSNNHEFALRSSGGSRTELISGTTISDTTVTHTSKVTRDSYGNFELLLDGSSEGTTTDSTHSESSLFWVSNGNSSTVEVDNLVAK